MQKPDQEIIEDFLASLKRWKEEKSFKSYTSIKNALSIFDIPFGFVVLSKGTPLFRTRCNENIDKMFEKVGHLGHRQDKNNITSFGRANEPLQSIFYCSTDYDTAFFEVSKTQRSKEIIQSEGITCGRWILTRDIIVAHIPSSSVKFQNNIVAKQLTDHFEGHYQLQSEDGLLVKKIIGFFSKEFSEDSCNEEDYLISCAVSNYIYHTPFLIPNWPSPFVDGITYPSVRLSSSGMNLALLPDLAYSGAIALDQVRYSRMDLVSSSQYLETITNFCKDIRIKEDKIIW